MATRERPVILAGPDRRWSMLYKVAGLGAIITVILFRRNFGAELMVSNGFGILDVPSQTIETAAGWFRLLQKDWIVGLYLLEVLDLVNFLMVGVMFLALYGALKHVRPAAMAVALAFCLMGVTLILATDQTLALLELSRQHASAKSGEQRALLETAGEALLAMDNPSALGTGTGSSVGLFLVLLAGIVVSAVMLRSGGIFSRSTGIIGLIANGVNICVFPLLILTPSYYYLPTPISAPFRVAWLVMVGIGLWKLGRRMVDGESIGAASS